MPKKLPTLYISLALMIVLLTIHVVGIYFYLYWYYWWYDWVQHTLAGLAGGFGAYWAFFEAGFITPRERSVLARIVSVALLLFLVGVAWEIFEYTNGITDSHEGYRLDTIHDLIADTTGAVVAAWICVRRRLGS